MTKKCELPRVRARQRGRPTPSGHLAGQLELERGLSSKRAVEEARRCLGSRKCESCEICSLFCPDLCITRDETTGEILIDLGYCKGCGVCAVVCPKKAIQMVLESL